MKRKDTIRAIDLCTCDQRYTCIDCPYVYEKSREQPNKCKLHMMKDALALLKEDCHNCKLECLLARYDGLKEKYDKLLAAYEALKAEKGDGKDRVRDP